MTKTAHTQGPWRFQKYSSQIWGGTYPSDKCVMTVRGVCCGDPELEISDADVALITAAPEMYEYLAHFRDNTSELIIGKQSWDALNAILTKATGEA